MDLIEIPEYNPNYTAGVFVPMSFFEVSEQVERVVKASIIAHLVSLLSQVMFPPGKAWTSDF